MICSPLQSKLCARAKNILLFVAVGVSSCGVSGCIESEFTLASESRLPKCVTLPPGLTREDVSVALEFYLPLKRDEPDAKYVLRDKKGRKLSEVEAKENGYIIVANGIAETIGLAGVIIEHGTAESIFYFDDDPVMKEFYKRMPICSKNLKELSKKWTGGPCRDREY